MQSLAEDVRRLEEDRDVDEILRRRKQELHLVYLAACEQNCGEAAHRVVPHVENIWHRELITKHSLQFQDMVFMLQFYGFDHDDENRTGRKNIPEYVQNDIIKNGYSYALLAIHYGMPLMAHDLMLWPEVRARCRDDASAQLVSLFTNDPLGTLRRLFDHPEEAVSVPLVYAVTDTGIFAAEVLRYEMFRMRGNIESAMLEAKTLLPALTNRVPIEIRLRVLYFIFESYDCFVPEDLFASVLQDHETLRDMFSALYLDSIS